MILFLLAFNILFVYYFQTIGLWYLSIIPIFFILFIIWTTSEDMNSSLVGKEDIKEFFQRNISIIAWLMIMTSLFVLGTHLNISGLSPDQISLGIILLNIVLLIGSYIFNFNDGISIFHYGYYYGIMILFYRIFISNNLSHLREIILLIIPLTFGLYTFINYIISNFSKIVLDNVKSLNFLFFNLCIIALIQNGLSSNMYFGTFISQIYLTLLFAGIFLVEKYSNKKIEEIINKPVKTVELILEGKKPDKPKINYKELILFQLRNFFNTNSPITSFMLSFLNIILVFFQIWLFFKQIGIGKNVIFYEMIYWLSIITFFGNYIILKKINLYYNLQRIFAFFVLNLGIYLSIINIFGKVPLYMAIGGITWNLITSLIIFASKEIKDKNIIYKEDLYLWIFANTISTIINSYFIFKLDFNYTIKFGFITLYLGIQLFIKYYNMKYIKNNF